MQALHVWLPLLTWTEGKIISHASQVFKSYFCWAEMMNSILLIATVILKGEVLKVLAFSTSRNGTLCIRASVNSVSFIVKNLKSRVYQKKLSRKQISVSSNAVCPGLERRFEILKFFLTLWCKNCYYQTALFSETLCHWNSFLESMVFCWFFCGPFQ